MKRYLLAISIVILTFCLFSSCQKKEKSKVITSPVFSTYLPDKPSDTSSVKEIYYGLMTPVEVCNIFEKLRLTYNDTIINPVENSDLYMTSYKAAMNLGVYGVDMGYMKLFGINKQIISYFGTIEKLSERLNVPKEYLADALKGVNPEMSNADSLTALMTRVYKKIDNRLRHDENKASLGLMMMAGWVESMYLSTQLAYNPSRPDPVVMKKIAQQKYSLLTLLNYMKNYYDDPMVVYYTKKLKHLNQWFDIIEIYYKKGAVSVDPQRHVILTSGSEMNVTIDTLNQIRNYIARLRKEIIMI